MECLLLLTKWKYATYTHSSGSKAGEFLEASDNASQELRRE